MSVISKVLDGKLATVFLCKNTVLAGKVIKKGNKFFMKYKGLDVEVRMVKGRWKTA